MTIHEKRAIRADHLVPRLRLEDVPEPFDGDDVVRSAGIHRGNVSGVRKMRFSIYTSGMRLLRHNDQRIDYSAGRRNVFHDGNPRPVAKIAHIGTATAFHVGKAE